MGEPVTEEMLARCESDARLTRLAGVDYPGADVEALVAEVRRLRAITCPTCEQASDAAGYARAERDVVAFITSAIDHDAERMRAAAQRGNAMQSNAYAAGHTALSLTRKRIEDHCHRGAAKDEAPRGEEDGR